MVIAFGNFPDDLAKWMDDKTTGLGGFVKSFGKKSTETKRTSSTTS